MFEPRYPTVGVGHVPRAALSLFVLALLLPGCGSVDGRSSSRITGGPLARCSPLNSITRVEAPAGHLRSSPAVTSRGPIVPPKLPGVELKEVDLAQVRGQLCAVFETRGQVRPPVVMQLLLRAKGVALASVTIDVEL